MIFSLTDKQLSRLWLSLIGAAFVTLALLGVWRFSITLAETHSGQPIGQGVSYQMSDETTTLKQIKNSDRWQTHQQTWLSFGLSERPLWLRFTLEPDSHKRLLELDYPPLDRIEIWFENQTGWQQHYLTGDNLPFSHRPLASETYLFPLPATKETVQVYIRVQTQGAMRLPVILWKQDDFSLANAEQHRLEGIFFGVLISILISHLLMFATTGNAGFATYCGYLLFMMLSLSTLLGIDYKYLWPQSTWWQQHTLLMFGSLTLAFGVIFSRELLQVRQRNQRLDQVLKTLAALFVLSALLGLLLPHNLMLQIFIGLMVIATITIVGMGLRVWYLTPQPSVRLYTMAWFILLLCAVLTVADHMAWITLSINSLHWLMLGIALEVILHSLSLALNYRDKQHALTEASRRAMQLEQQRLASEKQAHEELEYKVEERTLELEVALRELSEKNRELEEYTTKDAMTGIRNRRHFDKKYLAEVRRSRRQRFPLSIVMLDIDHFKRVNDEHGHLVGDACLKQIAQTLADALNRPADEVCRYGGEEFAMVLPDTDLDGANQLVDSIRQRIADTPIWFQDHQYRITISAGISNDICQLNQADDRLLKQADKALYQAKQNGRNRVEVYVAEEPHSV